jgi:hypothetical protein
MANLSMLAHQTASKHIAFLHAAARYPVPSTWLCAIQKGYFTTWPGLTPSIVKQHLQKSIITSLGHLDQQRTKWQSTTDPATWQPLSTTTPTPDDDPNSSFPVTILDKPHPKQRTYHVLAACTLITGQIFGNLPGKFVVPSSHGYYYTIV